MKPKNYIELHPFIPPDDILEQVEKVIRDVLRREIYLPILPFLKEQGERLTNSDPSDPITALEWALQKGTITFNRGRFSGKFEASVSKALKKLGAKWDNTDGTFRILSKDLPDSLNQAILSSTNQFQKKMARVDETLGKLLPEEIAKRCSLLKLFDKSLLKVDSSFRKNVESITVAPSLTEKQRLEVAKEWQENIQISIKGKAQDEISRLRKQIQESVFSGDRYGSFVQSVKTSLSVSDSRAKFIAKQETKLLMAKYNEVKLGEVGVHEYKWKCVTGTPAHPVRPRHRELSEMSDKGEIFRFDQPPIVSEPKQPVRRKNPQEDYSCRCRAVPIFRFKGSHDGQ